MRKTVLKLMAAVLGMTMVVGLGTGCGAKSSGSEPAAGGKTDTKAASGELEKVQLSVLTVPNGLPIYVAEQEGMFEEAGLDPELLIYTSAPPAMEALATDAWMVGSSGIIPSLTGMLKLNLHVVAAGIPDGEIVDIFVREDSPIAKSGKGHVEQYPELYGQAEDWKGITVLGPLSSMGHWALEKTLNAYGMSGKDVDIVNMQISAANTAFKAGQGDALIQWQPLSFDAERNGWIRASVCSEVGGDAVSVLYASDKAVKEKPETVQKIVEVYFKAAAWIGENPEKATEYFYNLCNDNGVTVSMEDCKKSVEFVPFLTVKESQEYMKKEADGSSKISDMYKDIMEFLSAQGIYTQEDLDKIINSELFETKFIDGVPAE